MKRSRSTRAWSNRSALPEVVRLSQARAIAHRGNQFLSRHPALA